MAPRHCWAWGGGGSLLSCSARCGPPSHGQAPAVEGKPLGTFPAKQKDTRTHRQRTQTSTPRPSPKGCQKGSPMMTPRPTLTATAPQGSLPRVLRLHWLPSLPMASRTEPASPPGLRLLVDVPTWGSEASGSRACRLPWCQEPRRAPPTPGLHPPTVPQPAPAPDP